MVKIDVVKARFMLGLMDQNTYVLTKGKFALVIDAGAEVDDVKKIVGDRKVLGVLMTHLHFDHFWNLEKYLEEFDTSVYIQEGAEYKFEDEVLNGSVLVRQNIKKNISKKRIKYYAKNLVLENFDVEVISTPGHSADSVCILIEDKLFSGDTIFADSIGRIDLKDSDKNQMIESLEKIRETKFSVALPGHYESATKEKIEKTISFYL